MIVELGHFALVLALVVALAQTVLPLWGAQINNARLMSLARPAALAQLLCILIAFAALLQAYITCDFSVAAVAHNSNAQQPLIYRMAGLWGNHEGSLLLWVTILAIYGAAVAAFGDNLPTRLAGSGPGDPGADRARLPRLHAVHLEPVPAPRSRAGHRCRTQSDPAGSRPRLSSADPLSRLCRSFDGIFLCRRST